MCRRPDAGMVTEEVTHSVSRQRPPFPTRSSPSVSSDTVHGRTEPTYSRCCSSDTGVLPSVFLSFVCVDAALLDAFSAERAAVVLHRHICRTETPASKENEYRLLPRCPVSTKSKYRLSLKVHRSLYIVLGSWFQVTRSWLITSRSSLTQSCS